MHTMDTIHRENTIYHVYKLDSLLFLTKTLFESSNNLNGIENNLNGITNNLYYSKTLLVLIYKEKKGIGYGIDLLYNLPSKAILYISATYGFSPAVSAPSSTILA